MKNSDLKVKVNAKIERLVYQRTPHTDGLQARFEGIFELDRDLLSEPEIGVYFRQAIVKAVSDALWEQFKLQCTKRGLSGGVVE